jgi:hypothetical protein
MNVTTFTLELWHVISLVVLVTGAMWGLARNMLAVQLGHIDARLTLQDAARQNNHTALSSRLDGIEQINREEAGQWQRIERELMSLKADLPINYVRREDYIRGQSVLEAKLDGLAIKIENAQLRGLIQPGAAR